MTLTAQLPSWLSRRDFPDWLPPSLVKALRQSLRSHVLGVLFVWSQISLGLLFALQVAIGAHTADVFRRWQWLDMFLILGVLLPLWPIASEDEDMREESRDLMRLSRVSPQDVVNGKLACVFTQAAFLTLAMVPYRLLWFHLGWEECVADMKALVWILANMAVLAPWGIFVGALPLAGRIAFIPLLLGTLLADYDGFISVLQMRDDDIWYWWFLVASVVCMVGCKLAGARYNNRGRRS